MAFYSRIGNFTAVAWCTLGSGLLGLFLLVTGSVLTGVAYTEITPPNWDENYLRYQGSNMMRIVGPLLMAAGGFLLFGSCGFFAYAFWAVNTENDYERDTSRASQKIEYTAAAYTSQDDKL